MRSIYETKETRLDFSSYIRVIVTQILQNILRFLKFLILEEIYLKILIS